MRRRRKGNLCNRIFSWGILLPQRATKIQERIRKILKKNNELNTNEILYEVIQKGKSLLAFEENDLSALVFSLEDMMKEIQKRIDYLEQPNPTHPLGIPSEESGDQLENMSQIEGDFTESLLCLTYENEMGLPNWNFGGSNYDGSDLGLANKIDNFEGQGYVGSDMGLPPVNYGGITGGSEMGLGMFPKNGNSVVGSSWDTGLGTVSSMVTEVLARS
ncbi:hypothetical protein L3X38_002937 [Prunus dulcis]|uniref:MADS-box domain-containing protein n=1 Tax=Prunus dulcis TaxID=3755 RepID=A0AAD4ZLD6_PRUDU|nr:hypothetical protein L3X38_002937 [Prunus dulcis]